MHDFLKLHHNWDAYMGVEKERKNTFLTAFEKSCIRTGSRYLFDFYNEISLRVIQDVTNDGANVLLGILSIQFKIRRDRPSDARESTCQCDRPVFHPCPFQCLSYISFG